jgi:O-antigen/teichoic acid export membrane protein
VTDSDIRADVRRKAARGTLLLTARSLLLRLVGFGGALVLARLLAPEDFGVVALGMTISALGAFLANGGLGAVLIRRPEDPTHQELAAVLCMQLLVTSIVALGVAGWGLALGGSGAILAFMMIALPFYTFRAVPFLLFQRRLQFRNLVAVDVVESLSFVGWAIVTAVLGWDAWALASAVVVRTVLGSCMATWMSPVRRLRPRWSTPALRGLIGFGIRFQAVGVVNMARDITVVSGTVSLTSLAVLGLYDLAQKTMAIPRAALESVWNVSFPALARLHATGEDLAGPIGRAASTLTVTTAIALIPIAVSGPAFVPIVFGEPWESAADVVPWISLALIVGGPIGVCCHSLLFAVGKATEPLIAAVADCAARISVSLILLPSMGVGALGVGVLAGVLAGVPFFTTAVRRHAGIRIGRRILMPAIVAAAAITSGLAISRAFHDSALGGLTGAAAAVVFFVTTAYAVDRGGVRDTWAMAHSATRFAAFRPQSSPSKRARPSPSGNPDPPPR